MSNWYDLTLAFQKGMPIPDWPGEHRQEFELTEFRVPVNHGIQNILAMNLHCGTHLDAPLHYSHNSRPVDKLPVEDFIGSCLVLDLNKSALEPVTLDDLRPYEEQMSGKKMVFIRTGWEDKWNDKSEYESKYPWITAEVGQLFLKKNVKIMGLDTPGPDPPIRSGLRTKGEIVHIDLLSNDRIIIENLTNLKAVVGKKLIAYALPLKIAGATGSPARVVAQEIQ